MKKIRTFEEFTLRYTDSAQAQLGALPFDLLSQVEGELERICQRADPRETGEAEEGISCRRRYAIGPVCAVAWVTFIEPDTRLLTVVEILFPDQPTTEEEAEVPPVPPMPQHPPTAQIPVVPQKPRVRRIMYARRHMALPAEL